MIQQPPAHSALRVSASTTRSEAAARTGWLTAERFVGMLLASCLLLQRFAIPFGTLEISVATPLILILAMWGLLAGIITIERRRTAVFCALCAAAAVSMAVQTSYPVAFAPRSSLNSLLYWLLITGFAIFRLRQPLEESRFFAAVQPWLLVVATAGVLQFIVQFAGLSLFTFRGFVPMRFLIESQYNVVIPLGIGGIVRANGFFLVEPSVFSQFMALGIIIEWLCFRRLWPAVLLFTGLLASVSGTGWLVLATFMIQSMFTSRPRDAMRAIGFALACGMALAVASVVIPDVTDVLFGRAGEISESGSSGYARFITPFLVLRHVLAADPLSFWTGLGPGASTKLLLNFRYWLNTPTKILIEYGIFGLVSYTALVLLARRTSVQARLVLPLLILLMFTGGYQEFSPILFPVLLIATTAFLQRAPDARVLASPGLGTPIFRRRATAQG